MVSKHKLISDEWYVPDDWDKNPTEKNPIPSQKDIEEDLQRKKRQEESERKKRATTKVVHTTDITTISETNKSIDKDISEKISKKHEESEMIAIEPKKITQRLMKIYHKCLSKRKWYALKLFIRRILYLKLF